MRNKHIGNIFKYIYRDLAYATTEVNFSSGFSALCSENNCAFGRFVVDEDKKLDDELSFKD